MLEIREETLEAGAVVGGLYRLERIVGEGGMGVVWAAREHATGRRVALKFLREGREADLRNQERVLREARAAMAISHENVAKIEAVLETDAGVPFLVMELLEGESLRELLRRRHTLTTLECARILLPVVEAVLAAHASLIVHRDLKPENVFLGKDQRVRVLDFGIAKQFAEGRRRRRRVAHLDRRAARHADLHGSGADLRRRRHRRQRRRLVARHHALRVPRGEAPDRR